MAQPPDVNHTPVTETRPSVESLLEAWGGHVALLSPTGRVCWVSNDWEATMRDFGLTQLSLGNDYWHALQSAIDTHAERIDALIHAIEQVRSHQQHQVALEMAWSSARGVRHMRIDITELSRGFALLQMREIAANGRDDSDLVFLAYHDQVTGLPNRVAASASITQALRRSPRTGLGMGIVYCDLDDFKHVNDRLGHRAGDAVLTQVGQRWRLCIRDTDTLARVSGDEFLLVADGVTGPAELAGLTHRMSDALVQPITAGNATVRVSASFGAVFVDSAQATSLTEAAALDAADAALYAAKGKGNDSVVVRSVSAALQL